MRKVCNWLFSLLWLADTMFTIVFVGKLGYQMEANPMMRWVLMYLGYVAFVWVKFLTWAFWIYMQRHLRTLWAHAVLVVMMIPIVFRGAQMAFGG